MAASKLKTQGRLRSAYDLSAVSGVFRDAENAVNPLIDGFLFQTTAVIGNYTINSPYSAVFIDASSATAIATLSEPASLRGMRITVKKTDASANPILISSAGGALIDGVTVQSIGTQYASLDFIGDNSKWYIV